MPRGTVSHHSDATTDTDLMKDKRSDLTTQLASSAGVTGSATFASRLLGLVRDQVLAYLFGAGNTMDAFNVAFRIPNLMRDLFAEGAMSAAFIPTFTKRLTLQGKESAWRLGNQLINALIIITGFLVILGMIFAVPLVELLAGNYSSVPGKLDLTVSLTRIMLPFLTLVAIAAALMGMLNSLNHFFTPALSPAMFNIGVILSALLFVPIAPLFGIQPIIAVAIGAMIGGLGQIVIQMPVLAREGYRYRLQLNPSDSGLREILLLMGPGTVAGAAVQINLLVNTILATGEGTGAVSWLNYAFRIMYLPIGLFGVSIATATLPTISRSAAKNDLENIRSAVSSALRMMLMLGIPACFGLIALAEPIVQLIFERGSFTETDTSATATALIFYAPGLIGYSAVRIIVPCFYALKNSFLPTGVSIVSVMLNIGLNLLLVQQFGYRGLALGTSIAALFNAAILVYLLRGKLKGLDLKQITIAFGKISVASALMAAMTIFVHQLLQNLWPQPGLLSQMINVGVSIFAGLIVLIASAQLLRIREWEGTLNRFILKIRHITGRK